MCFTSQTWLDGYQKGEGIQPITGDNRCPAAQLKHGCQLNTLGSVAALLSVRGASINRWPSMKNIFRHFSRTHLHVFLGFYLAFGALTFFALWEQSPSDWRENWNVAATVGCLSGPFTGAIARQFQGCCLEFSLGLLPYCAAFLLGGFAFQVVPIPFRSIERPARLVMWCIGLFGWFGGGMASFAHALS